jgi:hypothetical protein
MFNIAFIDAARMVDEQAIEHGGGAPFVAARLP